MRMLFPLLTVVALAMSPVVANAAGGRWSEEKANAWYQKQPWLVGANYVPAGAINQLEMWRKDTWNPEEIDRELGWAAAMGMNTMRVFLHDLMWKHDRMGFLDRVDEYLRIAEKHRIKTLFVIFDDVWDPDPVYGQQPKPRPGVHNSGWVQSPGRTILSKPASWDRELKPYVKDVIGRFKNDPRVLAWDLYNEPGNPNGSSYGGKEPKNKEKLSTDLLAKVFEWAREVAPSQPLTAGIWNSNKNKPDNFDAMNTLMSEQSDIISFHTYSSLADARRIVEGLQRFKRPILCTEYMARPNGSTFEAILPFFKEQKISAYNWGFVAGKSGTMHGWSTWDKPDKGEPEVWFHDILRPDGTPYSLKEVEFIKEMTAGETW